MVFMKYNTGVTNYIAEYMECKCMSSEHLIKFHLDVDEGELCLDIHLADWKPWYKRIWTALKYVFGYKSKYGDFDEVILKDEDVDRLMELLAYQKKIKNEAKPNGTTL